MELLLFTSLTFSVVNYLAQLAEEYDRLHPRFVLDGHDIASLDEFCEIDFIQDTDDNKKGSHANKMEKQAFTFVDLSNEICLRSQSEEEKVPVWLVSGIPGSGKTTFMNRLGRSWSERLKSKKSCRTLFLVRLIDLNDKEVFDLASLLREVIPSLQSCDPYYLKALEGLNHEIIFNEERFVFAFDGFDEYQRKSEDNWIMKIIKRRVL